MGIFRLILASVVMLVHLSGFFPAHLNPYTVPRPITPVVSFHIFFIISGFFTQDMLNRYGGQLRHYYARRFLKLLPVYYLSTLLTALMCWCLSPLPRRLAEYYQRIEQKGAWAQLYQNTTLFIPELYRLWDFSVLRVENALFIPQAWSMSVEFCFILIAPFLLRGRAAYLAAWGVALVYACWLNSIGLFRNYMAVSLLYFMAGTLAYRFYHRHLAARPASAAMRLAAFAAIAFFTACFIYYEAGQAVLSPWGMYGFMLLASALALPFIFKGTQGLAWDRALGELAYPIYLGHYMVAGAFQYLSPATPPQELGVYVLLAIVLYAACAYLMVTRPIMRRTRMFYRPQPLTS